VTGAAQCFVVLKPHRAGHTIAARKSNVNYDTAAVTFFDQPLEFAKVRLTWISLSVNSRDLVIECSPRRPEAEPVKEKLMPDRNVGFPLMVNCLPLMPSFVPALATALTIKMLKRKIIRFIFAPTEQ
jgi:hypothetical protein